jgi:hypothetical protein
MADVQFSQWQKFCYEAWMEIDLEKVRSENPCGGRSNLSAH